MKKLLLIPALILFACANPAQSSGEKTGYLLWKISGNGLKSPSYIFGTHHLYPVKFLDSIPGVKKAFASCEQMVGELLTDDMLALAGVLQQKGLMPQDSTYQLLLSADDYSFLDEQLTAIFGMGLQTFGMFKPAMISLMYIQVFYQKMFPQTNPAEAMDIWFQQQAAERGIPIIGLETVEDQAAALFNITSLRQQAADLICALKNVDHSEQGIKKMNALYRSADLNGLIELLREESPCPWSAEQEIAINDARNERWLKKLPAIMAERSSFIAVGGLHLAGEAGLLHGLEQAGYTVEAVRK